MFRKIILSSLIAVGMSSCAVAALVGAPGVASMAAAPAAVASAR